MNKVDVVKQAFAAVEAGDYNKFRNITTDNLMFEGPVPEPMNRDGFFGLQKALVDAIPDWKFNARDFKEMGDKVACTMQIEGTHTRTLNLPPLLSHPEEPTKKHFKLPQEHIDFTFTGDKISRIHTEPIKGGGVVGILDQLGVKVMAH
jgi:predicted ester cyclase